MKFTAKSTDLGHIESLIRVVSMISKLSKQCVLRISPERLGFIQQGSLRTDGRNKFYYEITANCFFEDFRMEGWSENDNQIYLEITTDEFLQALRSASHGRSLKIKLTKKTGSPYLTLDVQLNAADNASRSVMHDVPIGVVQPRLWGDFAEPELPNFDVSLYLPNVKTVHKIVTAMKSMSTYMTISAKKKGGEMTFQIRTDPTDLTTYFKDLHHADWSDDGSESSQRSQLSGRRVAERPRSTNQNGNGDNNNGEKLYSARVDVKMLAQFLATQQSTHYRLIMSIVNSRMVHFCAISDELRFQYFMPSVDE